MKVSAPRVILIQEDGLRPVRYTDPRMAAEHWAQVKMDEWIEKHKKDAKYIPGHARGYRRPTITNEIFGDGKARYRKLKRRALVVFRKIMNEAQCSVD